MKTTTATEELGVMTKKNLLTHVHITAVYAFVRIYLTVHLGVEHFIISRFDPQIISRTIKNVEPR